MPDFCTCGAQLPPDAVFCHKCGKPQREVAAHEPEPEVGVEFTPLSAAPAPAPPAQTTVTFRDRGAVRVALLVGLTATLLGLVLPFLNWLAAGFFSVFFYRQKTKQLLNVSGGVRLGWITGVVMFPMWALTEIPEVVSGRLATALEQQMKNMPTRDPALQQQLASFFQSGLGIATMVLFTLAFLFLLIIGLSVAGGALGARMIRNRRVAG